MRFTVFRIVATLLIGIGLILLFTLPAQHLEHTASALQEQIGQARSCLYRDDFISAQERCETMVQIIAREESRLEMYLNHGSVSAVTAALEEANTLVHARDLNGTLAALQAADCALDHLLRIECFRWEGLL